MPRLLLVDDNPSIHKIAETLLAASSIELVCVDSAAVALEKVDRGDHFDVALVDTSMAVMDGWGLLARLREIPATARMPIAMMAGVLDTVDPERIKAAPIQGLTATLAWPGCSMGSRQSAVSKIHLMSSPTRSGIQAKQSKTILLDPGSQAYSPG